MTKLEEEFEALRPTREVREAFMCRGEVKDLPPEERERLWVDHQESRYLWMEFAAARSNQGQ